MSFQQIPFGAGAEFADNPEPRCPCLLLLDTSASMQGMPIQELNAGLQLFKDELCADPMASKRVEVAVITFGPVRIVSDFQTADQFIPSRLSAADTTPMGTAIETALIMLEDRKQAYRSNGVSYYRPWIFLITDGGPTDIWQAAADKVKRGEAANHFSFFAVAVEDARLDVLRQISVREPLRLKELRFRDLFLWLSNSLSSVSRSSTEDRVKLLNPATPEAWAQI